MYTIYRLINEDTGRNYIGMTSKPLSERLDRHLWALRRDDHPTDDLQQDWNAGHQALSIQQVRRCATKEQAMKAEIRAINAEISPYNIRRGNPGDLIGRLAPVTPPQLRPYVYAEIASQRTATSAYLTAKYGYSAAMISMIRSGVRTATRPGTGFGDVLTDDATRLDASAPSRFRAHYARAAA